MKKGKTDFQYFIFTAAKLLGHLRNNLSCTTTVLHGYLTGRYSGSTFLWGNICNDVWILNPNATAFETQLVIMFWLQAKFEKPTWPPFTLLFFNSLQPPELQTCKAVLDQALRAHLIQNFLKVQLPLHIHYCLSQNLILKSLVSHIIRTLPN